MFYSTLGYAQLEALINISCPPSVAADEGGEGGVRSEVRENGRRGLTLRMKETDVKKEEGIRNTRLLISEGNKCLLRE